VFRVSGKAGEPSCPALTPKGSSDLVSGLGCRAMRFHSRLPVSSGEGFRQGLATEGPEPVP
jgi:hypothetical protein